MTGVIKEKYLVPAGSTAAVRPTNPSSSVRQMSSGTRAVSTLLWTTDAGSLDEVDDEDAAPRRSSRQRKPTKAPPLNESRCFHAKPARIRPSSDLAAQACQATCMQSTENQNPAGVSDRSSHTTREPAHPIVKEEMSVASTDVSPARNVATTNYGSEVVTSSRRDWQRARKRRRIEREAEQKEIELRQQDLELQRQLNENRKQMLLEELESDDDYEVVSP